jgi:hypothetical protein
MASSFPGRGNKFAPLKIRIASDLARRPEQMAELPEISRASRRVAWYGSSRNENGSHNPHEDTNIEDTNIEDFMSGVCVMRKVLAEAAL